MDSETPTAQTSNEAMRQASRCLIFGDLLVNDNQEVACFIEYLPDDKMYEARLISYKDKETFCVETLNGWSLPAFFGGRNQKPRLSPDLP